MAKNPELRLKGTFADMETVHQDLVSVMNGKAEPFTAEENAVLNSLMCLPEQERFEIRGRFIMPIENPLYNLQGNQRKICKKLTSLQKERREKILVRTIVMEILGEDT